MKSNKTQIGILLVGIILLCGCKEETPAPTPVVEATVEETVEPVEEVVTPEAPEATVVEESAEEPKELAEDWVNSIEEDFCLAIWNEANNTKDIVSNGEKYELQNGDRIFIHTPSMMIACRNSNYKFDFDIPYDNYTEIISFVEESEMEISMDIECKGGEKCHFECILVGDTNLGVEEITEDTEEKSLTIENGWEKELNYEVPTIVVWNNKIGFKQAIAEGETYQLQQGDQIVIYCPTENDFIKSISDNYTSILYERFQVIDFYSKPLTEETKFTIEFLDWETFEETNSEFTLLPIQ